MTDKTRLANIIDQVERHFIQEQQPPRYNAKEQRCSYYPTPCAIAILVDSDRREQLQRDADSIETGELVKDLYQNDKLPDDLLTLPCEFLQELQKCHDSAWLKRNSKLNLVSFRENLAANLESFGKAGFSLLETITKCL